MYKTMAIFGILASFAAATQAQSIYGQLGVPGVGIGYAYGISPKFTARADISTLGSFTHNGSSKDFDYKGKLKFNQLGAYLDWFPFGNGFRVSAGLNFRDAKLTADANPKDSGRITIGDQTVAFATGDSAVARVKLPAVAPYLGVGWGHNVATQQPGFSFIADIGVAYGKPKVSMDLNQALMDRLDAATGGNGRQEVDKQLSDIRHDANKIKFFPQVFIGMAYRF